MSEKAELTALFYKISPVTDPGKSIGAGRILPTSQRVHVDADIHVWKITEQEPGVFRLSLRDSYPYTGVEDEKEVVVTTDQGCDKEWRINYWKEIEAWSIDLKTQFFPTPAWTVSSEKDIVLKLYEVQPNESQLFKIQAFVGP